MEASIKRMSTSVISVITRTSSALTETFSQSNPRGLARIPTATKTMGPVIGERSASREKSPKT